MKFRQAMPSDDRQNVVAISTDSNPDLIPAGATQALAAASTRSASRSLRGCRIDRMYERDWSGSGDSIQAGCGSLDSALRAPLGMTASVIPSERSESRDLHFPRR